MKSIKLFLLAIIAMCFCANVNAVELGDYMEIDGVPAIVIYVDATGEHGLVMSAIAPNSLGEKETKLAAAFSVQNKINAQKIFSSDGWKEYKIGQETNMVLNELILKQHIWNYPHWTIMNIMV